MIYADTSCLIPLFLPEPITKKVEACVLAEDTVVVSSLTELETLVQLHAAWVRGKISRSQWRQLEAHFQLLRNQPPFRFRNVRSTLFQTGVRQHRNAGEIHCRTLDRLHLAAMEELKVERLLTADRAQAEAAQVLGFKVVYI